jgi:hypothetical protein
MIHSSGGSRAKPLTSGYHNKGKYDKTLRFGWYQGMTEEIRDVSIKTH